MIRYIFISLLWMSSITHAQSVELIRYDWNTYPENSVSDTIKPVNGSLITLERRINEFYLNSNNEFEEFSIYHRKVKVESHDAINMFNKIYVPVGNAIEVIAVKARFISPTGRITELPKESIKEIENLENKGNFQTFAIEGVELGGEIEYFFKVRRRLNAYGSITPQSDVPKANVESIFIYPSSLQFMTKSYNGFPSFTETADTVTGKTWLKASAYFIPSLTEENYSAYQANLMRYEYTITHNLNSSVLRIYSFSKVAQNVYSNLFITTKKEKAAVKEALKKIKTGGTDAERIRTLENWLKTELLISENLTGAETIDEMLKLKQTSEYGVTRLFVSFLTEMNINFEIVLTCDHTERQFDPEFNGWNYMNDYLIYIPQCNQYIAPDNTDYRLGITPSYFQGSYGLFLHPITVESLNTLAYDIRKIPQMCYKENSDTLLIQLHMNMEQMNVDADIRRVFTGELASTFQSFWTLSTPDRQKEVVSNMFDMGTQNITIRSYSVQNDRPEDIFIKPFIWNVNLTANALLEMAGEDIIFKVGETIGEQSQLYQINQRSLPVYVGNLHNYFRQIEFKIPNGYSVSNLENLKMNVEMVRDGKVSCCFKSDYTLEGDILKIQSIEYYSEMYYPKKEFEAFRDVINAAADFNKKTILLTRK